MSDNDLIVLNTVLRQRKVAKAPELPEDAYFEYFVFEQILKNYDLSYDDLNAGNTDGRDDGGIDGVFIFLNGFLVDEQIDESNIQREPKIDLFIIQAKTSEGFTETAIDKINSTSQNLFDLSTETTEFSHLYNEQIIEKFSLFRDTYLRLASHYPKLSIRFYFASKGNTNTINVQLSNRRNNLVSLVEGFFHGSNIKATFVGAKELLDLSRREQIYTLTLKLLENPLTGSTGNYVVLSSLIDYYNFVVDEEGNLRRYIFESNVRDFQGYGEVNNDINRTLSEEEELDFWWLNNGITILGSQAAQVIRGITIDNVKIINGLQTTECIYNYLNPIISSGQKVPQRIADKSILVKILITEDEIAKDKIIKATNFQTPIQPASFRATDRIHNNLEDYFKSHDWYYDRRKNYYKNMGKPLTRIIGIPYMAQCMMSLIHKEPHSARARPSSLVKKDSEYQRVFNESINPGIYLFCAQATRKVENRLKFEIEDFTNQEKTNLKLHIAMILIMKMTGNLIYAIQDIVNLNIEDIDDELIDAAAGNTIGLSRIYIEEQGVSLEKSAKSGSLSDYLKANLEL